MVIRVREAKVGAIIVPHFRRRRQQQLAIAFPHEPWKGRADWAAGIVRADWSAPRDRWLLIAFVVLFVPPLSMGALGTYLRNSHWLDLAKLVAAGCAFVWLVGSAVRLSAVYFRFRKIRFVLGSVPGVIGGRLTGDVRLPSGLKTEDGFHLTLTCCRRVKCGSSRHVRIEDTVLWQDMRVVTERVADRHGHVIVPVDFDVPHDLPDSDLVRQDDGWTGSSLSREPWVDWTLEITAANPGTDLAVRFLTPVFKTSASIPDSSIPQRIPVTARIYD